MNPYSNDNISKIQRDEAMAELYFTLFDNQRILNTVVKGARAQNWERSVEGSACVYRGPFGRRCHAGHLIPDVLYHTGFEHMSSESVLLQLGINTVLLEKMNPRAISFVMALQIAHDANYSPETVEEATRQVTEQYSLTWPED